MSQPDDSLPPIPNWFRKQFVNQRTKRLSPRFFFGNKGRARKPFLDYLKSGKEPPMEGNLLLAFTPYIVLLPSHNCYELVEQWAIENASDAWFYWIASGRSAVGFRSKVDATLFCLGMEHVEPMPPSPETEGRWSVSRPSTSSNRLMASYTEASQVSDAAG